MDRKTEIILAASKLLGNEGIKTFTTKKLAAALSLSEGALYRHFSGKDEILLFMFDYFDRMINDMLADALSKNQPAKEKIITVFECHKTVFQQYPELIFLFFSEGSFIDNQDLTKKVQAMMDKKFALMGNLIKTGQELGEIRKEIEPEELVKVIMGYFRLYILKLKMDGNTTNMDLYCSNFFMTIPHLL